MASQDITRHDTATAGSSPEDENEENLNPEEPPSSPRQYQTVAQQTRDTVRALRIHTGWSYPQLQVTFHISLSSLHRITHRTIIRLATRGRRSTITEEIRERLLATATASAENRRLPYRQVAELAG